MSENDESLDLDGRILVTGGAGYIGSHLCTHLAELGCEPIIIDNLATSRNENLPPELRRNVFNCDIADFETLQSIIRYVSPTPQVFHFAALTSVAESQKDMHLYDSVNVTGTFNLIQALRRNSSSFSNEIVFASTCAIYGDSLANEEPKSYYAKSKLLGEKLLDSFNDVGVKAANLRFYNVAGCSNPYYEFPEESDMIFPALVRAARKGKPFRIYGTNYDTHDGTAVRDYIHVDDIVDAAMRAMHELYFRINTARELSTANLGSGEGYSVKEIVDAFKRRVPYLEVEEAPAREGDASKIIFGKYPNQDTLLGIRNHNTGHVKQAWKPKKNLEDMIDDIVKKYDL